MSQVIDPMEAEPLDAIVVDDGPSKVTLAATWIVVALLAFLALWWTWNHVINPNGGSVVDRYVAGDGGHLYESLRDEFRVELPTTPQRRESANGVVVVDSRPGPDYLFAVIRQPEPDTALENYTPTLNTAAGALADAGRRRDRVAERPHPDPHQRRRDQGRRVPQGRPLLPEPPDPRERSPLHPAGDGEGQEREGVHRDGQDLQGPRTALIRRGVTPGDSFSLTCD